ncbi:MAG TPA: glycosyltransferase [Saprospiraceae bacterium]|nr:glycosyltransferase [Saprospiraceae bacterium]
MFSEFVWPFLFWVYVAATLVQLAFYWGLIRDLGFRIWDWGVAPPTPKSQIPNPHPQIPNPPSPISLIICARNEADNLRRHLPKVLNQQYAGAWELIVVDDASEDDTAGVLEFFSNDNPRLRVVRVSEKKQAGKKYALAQGIAAAKYKNLLLTDADCEPATSNWLACMADALSAKPQTEIVLGYGPVVPAPGFLNGWIRYETAHTAIQYMSFAVAGLPYMGVGRNLAFKKQVYERTGGFAAHADVASGDDDLLVNAAATAENVTICLNPGAFMYSEGKKTWREWSQQKRRHLTAGARYKPVHQAVLTLLSLSHTLHFFLLPILLLTGFGMVSVIILFFARSFSLLFLYNRILPQLREFHLLSRVPIYDTLLAAYYGAFVPISLIAPRSARFTWK